MAARIETIRTRVVLHDDHVENTASTAFPGTYPGVDDSWDFEQFKENFRIDIIKDAGMEMEFDMVGVDAAIANTLRRIMIAEVPTIAIETCLIYNNTSIIPDESLAHRLGLVPLDANPRKLSTSDKLVFCLKVVCERNSKVSRDAPEEERFSNSKVYSGQLEWIPQGAQKQQFPEGVRPVHDDILLAKLRPGQEINVEAHCVKGVGKDHAKFSPVATASYRLLPEIILTQPVTGAKALLLQQCFSKGVIEVSKNSEGEDEASVVDARKDTMSREVFRHPELSGLVQLQRVRDHFIFSIESTGAMVAADVFRESTKVLSDKCDTLLTLLAERKMEE